MRDFFQNEMATRIRQYGLRAALLQASKVAIRPLYRENRDLIFMSPGFSGYDFHDPNISILSRERIEKASASGELDQAHMELLLGFLNAGCQGIYAEIEGKLAGYAWVQLRGDYNFGRTGHFSIPPQYALFKNLFVVTGYRGMRLGQKLNAARLALVPPGYTPVVFIIPDNRYAIRNWEFFGFQRVIEIKRWQWGKNGTWRMSLTRLAELPEIGPLLQALEASGDG